MKSIEFSPDRRVLVVGDAMLDRYHEGEATRISPEAPVPVMSVRETFERPGGAANVAMNIAALGLQVTLVCFVGKDADAAILETLLLSGGVRPVLVQADACRTIVKLRALSIKQQIMRLDFEDNFAVEDHRELIRVVQREISQHDLVVLSDYAKGTLREAEALIGEAKRAQLPILTDPKGLDFARYKGATALTPNMREFTAVAGTALDEADLLSRASRLRARLELDHLVLTRGEEGITLVLAENAVTFPAQAREVYDVTGAGDTVIATLAASMASGLSIEDSVVIANHAAGLVVSRKGTAAVTGAELAASLAHGGNIASPERVLEDIRSAQRQGVRVVMTNGCFDLLHAGHVDYLTRARTLGDRLLVAVNSDASVRRLKGEHRPFNLLEHRLKVLAALRAVDWVVAFDGSIAEDGRLVDTPLDLISTVRPHVLVKGGDYQPDTIVGAREVRSWGGQVHVLPFVEGQSSTRLASKILESKAAA